MAKISKHIVDASIPKSSKYFIWDQGDGAVKGFGLAVYPSGVKSYVYQYRNEYGRTQRMTIGKSGDLMPHKARQLAKDIQRGVMSGEDPAGRRRQKRSALTVGQLLDEYLDSEKFASKAESTRSVDRGRIQRHLRPLLGTIILETLRPEDVRRAFAGIRDGKTATDQRTKARGRAIVRGGEGAARMAIRVLRAILSWGIEQGLLKDNPAAGVKLGRDGERTAVMTSQDEYARLFRTLDKMQEEHRIRPAVAECIRVLALTGARRNEIAGLRWGWVDLKRGAIILPASAHKTGKNTGTREITLPAAAQQIIARQPDGGPSDYVFPPAKGEGPLSLAKPWRTVRAEAQLPDEMGLHGLRHSLATMMAVQGAEAPQIMTALGHRQLSTAARYIKSVDDARREMMEKHTAGISAAMTGSESAEVIEIDKGAKRRTN